MSVDPAIAQAEAKRISMLRMQMLEMHPFWGYLLLQLRIVPAPQLECLAATDCVHHIWFNPDKTQHLSAPQLGFVLAHEVGHQLFATEDRQRGRSHHLWNCATDYAINRIVSRIGHPGQLRRNLYEAPEGNIPGLGQMKILLDPRFDGKIAEAIYEYLAAEELPEPVSVTLTLDLDGDADGGGSGPGHGGGRIRVPNLTDHGGGIDIHLPENLSPEQREELQDRVIAAVEHWSSKEQAGDIPGGMVRKIRFARRHQVPWQRLFRSFAGQATARDDYSYSRPSRRYLEHDILVPGLRSEKVGRVVVAVDTSGSMTQDQLAAVGAELTELSATVEEMTLVVADAVVQEVVTDQDLPHYLQQARFRGGGTDHRPVFEWLRTHNQPVDLFIGLTDLFSEFPERRPACPVLWITPRKHGKAPWGRVIELD